MLLLFFSILEITFLFLLSVCVCVWGGGVIKLRWHEDGGQSGFSFLLSCGLSRLESKYPYSWSYLSSLIFIILHYIPEVRNCINNLFYALCLWD